jgi:hypothetical protein
LNQLFFLGTFADWLMAFFSPLVSIKDILFFSFSFFLFFFFFLYWSSISGPLHQPFFCDGYFWDRVFWTICPGCLQTTTLLISASWVASRSKIFWWGKNLRQTENPHSHPAICAFPITTSYLQFSIVTTYWSYWTKQITGLAPRPQSLSSNCTMDRNIEKASPVLVFLG